MDGKGITEIHLIHPKREKEKKCVYDHMNILPWHSLNETCAKMVISNCNLHALISYIGVAVTQQHHLLRDFSRMV